MEQYSVLASLTREVVFDEKSAWSEVANPVAVLVAPAMGQRYLKSVVLGTSKFCKKPSVARKI